MIIKFSFYEIVFVERKVEPSPFKLILEDGDHVLM